MSDDDAFDDAVRYARRLVHDGFDHTAVLRKLQRRVSSGVANANVQHAEEALARAAFAKATSTPRRERRSGVVW